MSVRTPAVTRKIAAQFFSQDPMAEIPLKQAYIGDVTLPYDSAGDGGRRLLEIDFIQNPTTTAKTVTS